jgi:DNA-binding CsgD family transcriptional regulator
MIGRTRSIAAITSGVVLLIVAVIMLPPSILDPLHGREAAFSMVGGLWPSIGQVTYYLRRIAMAAWTSVGLESQIAIVTGETENLLRAGKWEAARVALEAELENRPRPDVLRGLGEASWWLGDLDASNGYYRRAYAAYLRAGDSFAAAETALALCVTYRSCLGNTPVAAGWLARAERAVEGENRDRIKGWFWLMRAYLDDFTDIARILKLAGDALELGRAIGDKDLELCALGCRGIATVMMGRIDEGLKFVDEAMAGISGGENSRPETVVFVSCVMLNACEAARDWERMTKWRPVSDSFLDDYGCPYLYTECRSVHAKILLATGEWQEAERELQTTVRLTAGVFPAMHATTLGLLAELRLRQGRIDEAESLLAESEGRPEALPALAAVLMARGRHVIAKGLLQRCLRHLSQESLIPVRVFEMLIEAHLALGDIPSARETLERLRSNPCCDTSLEAGSRVHMAAGRIAGASGDEAAALAHFESANAAFIKLGMPYEAATARFAAAQTLSAPDPDLAIAEAQGALSAFEKLGAKDQADRAGALLRTLGVAARPGPRGLGVLSQREQEVLQLIGAGLSNPEIAERLYISRKTAAHHVSAILEKLGLRNRAEAAGYAMRLGTAAPR